MLFLMPRKIPIQSPKAPKFQSTTNCQHPQKPHSFIFFLFMLSFERKYFYSLLFYIISDIVIFCYISCKAVSYITYHAYFLNSCLLRAISSASSLSSIQRSMRSSSFVSASVFSSESSCKRI